MKITEIKAISNTKERFKLYSKNMKAIIEVDKVNDKIMFDFLMDAFRDNEEITLVKRGEKN